MKKVSILQVAYVIAMASKKSYLCLTYSTRNECAGYREFFVLICQPSKRQRTDLLARFTRAVLYVLAKTQGLRCILLAEINPWMKNSVLFRRSLSFQSVFIVFDLVSTKTNEKKCGWFPVILTSRLVLSSVRFFHS